MVRSYQPDVVISPRSGWEGDFQCNEGGGKITGPIIDSPWEKCLNLNQSSWGYHTRQNLMSLREIIVMLVNTVDRGGNVLLNVGPDADGVIPPTHIARLKEVGDWLQQYGEGIYGTRPGPFDPVEDLYGAVHKGNNIYVHLLQHLETLQLPALQKKVVGCRLLSGEALPFSQTPTAVTLQLKNLNPEAMVHTLVLETE